MSKYVGELVGEFIFLVVGWGICLGILGSAYIVGWWLAQRSGDSDPGAFGLLSALAFLWMYERREFHEKYERLCKLILDRHG
jgi:hypothetical protein